MTMECRAILRECLGAGSPTSLAPAIQAHLESCGFCAARVRASRQLAPSLRTAAKLPLSAAEALVAVRERIVEQAESSTVGDWLRDGTPVAESVAALDPADVAVGAAESVESGVENLVRRTPPEQTAVVWSRVRGVILARVAAQGTPWRRRRWLLGAAGVAAAVVILVAIRPAPNPPKIVFRDLDARELAAIGSVDFAIVRHGVER